MWQDDRVHGGSIWASTVFERDWGGEDKGWEAKKADEVSHSTCN